MFIAIKHGDYKQRTVKLLDNPASNIFTLDGGVPLSSLDYWAVLFVARHLPLDWHDENIHNN